MSLLARASLRHLLRHWAQCALAVSGIALGVALVVAIQVAQASARHSFASAISSVFGQTTHQVLSADGHFSESALTVIRRVAASAGPQPVVEGRVRQRVGKRGTNLRLIGLDMLTAAGSTAHGDIDLRALLLTPATAIYRYCDSAGIARPPRPGIQNRPELPRARRLQSAVEPSAGSAGRTTAHRIDWPAAT